MLEICICSHRPRLTLLAQVLGSIANQTEKSFRVLIVDSASPEPISQDVLEPLREARIEGRVIREEQSGVARARLRAIAETTSEWVLFCDDDNVLTTSFVAEGFAFIKANPNVGCIGGRLLLPTEIACPEWVMPFLPYLAIKDLGEESRGGIASGWREWEPPTAGAFVCRPVLRRFTDLISHTPEALNLGRSPKSLLSGEDSLMMRCAYLINKATAYNPRMVLYHHLNPSRFKFGYLFRLMRGYGHSRFLLEKVLQNHEIPKEYTSYANLFAYLRDVIGPRALSSWRFTLGMLAFHLTAYRAYRALYSGTEAS